MMMTHPTKEPEMNTPHAPARAIYTLTADQAHDLHRAATPWHSGSQARADPIYRDHLNNWWAALGLELGIKWTTVADLTWLAADGQPCAISDKPGEGYGLPDFAEVMGATFTAEPEAAGVPDELDPQAMEWMNRRYCNSGPVTDGCKWSTLEMATAFAAGRDKGFAMGSATVEALENRARLATAARSAVSRWMVEGQALLREAAALFREYETHHRVRVPREAHNARQGIPGTAKGGSLEKAERNADIAGRLESYLAAFNFRWEAVGDPRPHMRIWPQPFGESRPITQADVDRLTDVARKGPKLTGEHVISLGPPPENEVDQLRQLLADAMPAIEFVNGLATIEDADLDTFTVAQLRDQARGSLGDEGFKRPGTYTAEQRDKAAQEMLRVLDGKVFMVAEAPMILRTRRLAMVDAVAVALGLRLWTKGGPF